MLKSLIVTDNIYFAQKLLEELNLHKLNIRTTYIITSDFKISDSLDFDIIFLDKSMDNSHHTSFLKKHYNVIIDCDNPTLSNIITSNSLIKLEMLINKLDFEKIKLKLTKELEYLGYDFKYTGTHYLIDAVFEMSKKQYYMIDNLQGLIYPIIAKKYGKSISNIKSSISKSTENMYSDCESSKLAKYFNLNIDIKPTVKHIIFTLINKI